MLWKGAQRDLSKCSQNDYFQEIPKRYVWEHFENQNMRTHASVKKYHLRSEWENVLFGTCVSHDCTCESHDCDWLYWFRYNSLP